MYRCNIIWRGYNGKYETPKRSIAVENFDRLIIVIFSFEACRYGKI